MRTRGDDTTYYPLLSWLMPDEREDVGAEWLATVDAAGIPPDIYLPKPTNDDARKNEVVGVQRWLEGGSLAPINVNTRKHQDD